MTLDPPNSPLSLSSRRFNFARTDDSPAVRVEVKRMKMMTIMAGGLQTTNRLGSWVEQPNRMNLSLLQRDYDDGGDDDEDDIINLSLVKMLIRNFFSNARKRKQNINNYRQ